CSSTVTFSMVLARKRFGQHFLEPVWVEKVVRAIDPQPDEMFVEIGPGRGALTRPLAARARSVVACEIDRDLASALRATAPANLAIVERDFLATADSRLGTTDSRLPTTDSIRIAGNLPYNVASPILFALTEAFVRGAPIGDATLMLQREVADRLVADPGSKDYGVLTILIGHSADVERVLDLPPGAFRPPPKVHPALVRLRFQAADQPVRDREIFARLVQAVFTRRRKTLANALAAYRSRLARSIPELLASVAIDGGRRPETLSIAEFGRLADAYSADVT